MKIQVTKEDIEKGERGSCEWCPVALAIQRTYDLKNDGDEKMITVDADCVEIWQDSVEKQYQLPQIARDFIHDFDNDRKVAEGLGPFSFKIGKRININKRK